MRGIGAAAALAAFAGFGGAAAAGTPNDVSQVVDLNPGVAPSSHTDGPQVLTAAGDKVFFTASVGTAGLELYVSDGTAAGTHITKDINPAPNASSNPSGLTAVGGTLFFGADDGTNGVELWKSDGTAAGTVMVKDINTNPGVSSSPGFLTNVNGTLFFTAQPDTGLIGFELWKSDGTAAGTVQAADISTVLGGSLPADLTKVGGALYFTALDDSFDRELYRSDGTGATLVQNINTTAPNAGSGINQITDVNGVAYMRANDGVNGAELWKTNAAGTSASLVEDLNPGAASGNPQSLAAVGSTVYFQATATSGPATDRELYKSDGSGIDLVKNIADPGQSIPIGIVNVGGTLFFNAASPDGQELWRSDGTGPGTTQVKDINPGPSSSFPSMLTNIGGTLYFTASEPTTGVERWRSDGTPAGTVPIEDIEVGAGDSVQPVGDAPAVEAGSTVFFPAFQTGTGFELWKYADTIPPTVSIDSGPAAGSTITADSATFGFSSDDLPATFQCRLYAADLTPPAFSACSAATTHTATALANGTYTFDVQGRDSGGNTATATRSFSVAIPVDDPGPSARCVAARAALEKAEKKLAKAKAALKKAKKSGKPAKVKKAKGKVKKAKAKRKAASSDVAEAC